MHVAMVIDEERLTHEHAMLRRLCIGLMDHGMRLTRIVPPPDAITSEAANDSEGRIALAPRIIVPTRVLPWWRRARAERIAEALTIGVGKGGDQAPPDVIYAIGRNAWTVALDLADLVERPVAINVWSARLINDLPRPTPQDRRRTPLQRIVRPARRGAQHIAAYVAASPPIAEALGRRFDPAMIALVPMGASVPKRPRTILDRHPESIGIAVVGRCSDLRAYTAVLGGLSRLVGRYPGIQVAIELRGPKCHDVWRLARRADLLPFLSAIDDAAQHRLLLTQCDLLLVPERTGELTSLLLEAMAAGMPVVARNDPMLEVVIDEETALEVRKDSPEEWARQISRLLTQPDLARQLGEAARQRIRQSHTSAEQVRRLAATLESISRGGTYAFPSRE